MCRHSRDEGPGFANVSFICHHQYLLVSSMPIHNGVLLQFDTVVLHMQRAKRKPAARKHASETMKAFFSDPENRRKRSIAMIGQFVDALVSNQWFCGIQIHMVYAPVCMHNVFMVPKWTVLNIGFLTEKVILCNICSFDYYGLLLNASLKCPPVALDYIGLQLDTDPVWETVISCLCQLLAV